MKQRITEKQWLELDEKQRGTFCFDVNRIYAGIKMPTIGELIEFLGDDFVSITWIGGLTRETMTEVRARVATDFGRYMADEIADALWKAVKEKLR